MSDRIEEIRERLAKATPGPWTWGAIEDSGSTVFAPSRKLNLAAVWRNYDSKDAPQNHEQDAAFIANAPSDIDFLLRELTAAREAIDEAAKALFRERTFHPDLWAWPDRKCAQCHALQILDRAILDQSGDAG